MKAVYNLLYYEVDSQKKWVLKQYMILGIKILCREDGLQSRFKQNYL